MAAPVTEIKRNPLYWEKDPAKKLYQYGNDMVSLMRSEWSNVINVRNAEIGMAYLLSKQDMTAVKQGFEKAGEFSKNSDWIAIGVLDRIRNIIIAEFLKAAYTPQVEATDAAADNQKKKDKTLLGGRPMIEGVMSDLNSRTGDPPYKLPTDKFEGNVEMFDQMGLDASSPEDLTFFFQSFHRLWHEIDAQELLRNLMVNNEIENHVEDLVNDILAKMCVSYQVYASPFSGEIKWRYLKPEHIKAISGNRPDHKDAICLGFEENVSVRQFLDFCGPDFEWSRDQGALTTAVNFKNGTSYEFINQQGAWCMERDDKGVERPVLATPLSGVMKHTVGVGYVEWKSVDQVVKRMDKRTGFLYPLDPKDKERDFPVDSAYTKEIKEFQKTYKSHFLASGTNTQMIFRYGPLYHQLSSGAYDEFSSFSIHVYKGRGKPATRIVKPFVDVANKAFYKMLWAIDESTPRVRVLNYDAIAQLVRKLKPKVQPNPMSGQAGIPAKQNVSSQINEVLSHYRNSLQQLYANPEIEGQKLGGNGRPHYYEDGGIDPLAPAMQTVMDWAEAQVSARLGINGPRDAYTPDPKDGYKKNVAALEQSRNATYYIPFMMNNIIKNSCTTSLNLAQDAIEFETPTLTWIENLIGSDALDSFRSLNKVPFHSYGIFVNLFNVQEQKDKVEALAEMAYSRKEINTMQLVMVQNLDDPKKASLILAYYQQRNEKMLQKQAVDTQNRQVQLITTKRDSDIAVIDRKGYWQDKQENTRGTWYFRAHQEDNLSSEKKKQMDINSNKQKQQDKADAAISVAQAKDSLNAVQPLTVNSLTPSPANVSANSQGSGVPLPAGAQG